MKIMPSLYNKNSNTTFGAIIYRNSNNIPDRVLDSVTECIQAREMENPIGRKFNPEEIRGNSLYQKVIECDYDTPELQKKYAKLVESQKNNPVNVYIDLFSADGDIPLQADEWFQKATVGKRTFCQPTSYHFFGTIPPFESRIAFLEKACNWANILNNVNKAKKFLLNLRKY